MKKFLGLFLVIVLLFSLSACSNNNDEKENDIKNLTNEEIFYEYIEPLYSIGLFTNYDSFNSLEDLTLGSFISNYYILSGIDKDEYLNLYEKVDTSENQSYSDYIYLPIEIIKTTLQEKYNLSDEFFYDENIDINGNYMINLSNTYKEIGISYIDINSIVLNENDLGYSLDFEIIRKNYNVEDFNSTPIYYNYTLFLEYNLEKDSYYILKGESYPIIEKFNNEIIDALYMKNLMHILFYNFSNEKGFYNNSFDDDAFLAGVFESLQAIHFSKNLNPSERDDFNDMYNYDSVRYNVDYLTQLYKAYFNDINIEEFSNRLISDSSYNKEENSAFLNIQGSNIGKYSKYRYQTDSFSFEDNILVVNYTIKSVVDKSEDINGTAKIKIDKNSYQLLENTVYN